MARHSPTVMVKAGLMELAATISRLSPVARIESPSWVLRNRISSTAAARAISATVTSLPYFVPSSAWV